MDPRKMDMIKYAVAVIIMIVGLVILLHGLYQKWKVSQIEGWPTVRVDVLSISILPANSVAGTTVLQLQDLPSSTEDRGLYEPMVKYRYRVAGKTYDSEGLMYNQDASYTALETRTLLEPLTNRRVTAYYNPSDPDESFLYPSEANWVYPLLGAVLLVIGGLVAGYTAYCASKRDDPVERAKKYLTQGKEYAKNYATEKSIGLTEMFERAYPQSNFADYAAEKM